LDNSGNAYITGDIYHPSSIIFGSDTLTRGYGEEAGFIAKFTCGTTQCNLGPVTIQADTTIICSNDSAQICGPSGFESYQWNTGQTTRCFYTNLAGAYYLTVTDNQNCTATSNRVSLTVHTPPQVSISVNGDTLSAYNAKGYQWYWDGNAIPNATGSRVIATQAGQYTVQVTDTNGCSSLSNPVTITGFETLREDDVTIYPNPSNGKWWLNVNNEMIGCEVEVLDVEGKLVFKSEVRDSKSEVGLDMASGVYFLRLSTKEKTLVRKLVRL
jgi:hypothetical protein